MPSTHQHQLDSVHDTRTRMMNDFIHRHFGSPAEKKIDAIDLACHQGWFSSQLANAGFDSVLATDARENHIADAELIFNALGQAGKIRTLQSDVHVGSPGTELEFAL